MIMISGTLASLDQSAGVCPLQLIIIMALQRTGHTLMIWSRLSKWLLPSVKIIQPGCWSCHQHSKAASAISATYSKHNNLVHQRRPLS